VGEPEELVQQPDVGQPAIGDEVPENLPRRGITGQVVVQEAVKLARTVADEVHGGVHAQEVAEPIRRQNPGALRVAGSGDHRRRRAGRGRAVGKHGEGEAAGPQVGAVPKLGRDGRHRSPPSSGATTSQERCIALARGPDPTWAAATRSRGRDSTAPVCYSAPAPKVKLSIAERRSSGNRCRYRLPRASFWWPTHSSMTRWSPPAAARLLANEWR